MDCYVGLDWSTLSIEEQSGAATTWDTVLHQYYRNDRHVRADLAQVLAGRQPTGRQALPPEERAVRLPDGRVRRRFEELARAPP